jgi:hypothetical protein
MSFQSVVRPYSGMTGGRSKSPFSSSAISTKISPLTRLCIEPQQALYASNFSLAVLTGSPTGATLQQGVTDPGCYVDFFLASLTDARRSVTAEYGLGLASSHIQGDGLIRKNRPYFEVSPKGGDVAPEGG